MPSMSFRLLLIPLMLLAVTPARSAELAFAHYAPGAGDVRLQVDDAAPLSLNYKSFVDAQTYPAGSYRLRVSRGDGSLIAQGELDLRESERFVVVLAGNGSAVAPFQLRAATDHNWPLTAGQSSLQVASLAIVEVAGSPLSRPLQTGTICNSVNRSTGAEAFGSGTRPIDSPRGSASFSIEADRPACTHYALTPQALAADAAAVAEVAIDASEGDRLRRFLIGDGEHEPYEMVLVHQGSEAIKPLMEPDGSIEGVWSVAGEAGTSLQIAFDAEAPEGRRVSGVYFGFEPDGRAAWRTFEGLRLIEYVGGTLDGTRAAVGFERAGTALAAHSCMEMTLFVNESDPRNAVVAPAPRNAITLRRLFPATCPPAAPRAEGVR